ncbi:MAG: FAD-binding protein [Pseudomonadota bacterium]|nr:FAD-binding protein [Pseudomonadota bacterium]MDO7710208.1 FAD-binding protein [Pseudomonadota bacterium]
MNIERIQQRILDAEKLQIIGNNSQLKSTASNTLDMSPYAGFIGYHPDELVMTVKAGTRITEIKSILEHKGQILPFTVQHNDSATIGGAYSIGSPELRDAVLGVKVIDGQGQILTFGGQVMKNVAGYDVSRLLVGSKGRLVAVCEISFRVLPKAYANTVKTTITPNIDSQSQVRERIEYGLKKVFDPKGIFI